MNDETQNTEENKTQQTNESTQNTEENKAKGGDSDYVELSPEAQKKFNQLYKQVRASDENNKWLKTHAEKLEETVLDLANKLEAFQSKTSLTEAHSVVSSLESQLKQAIEEGDVDKQTKLISQLTDVKAEQKIKLSQPKKEAQPIKQEPVHKPDPAQEYINFLATETDAQGNVIRPWLNQRDPNYKKALELTEKAAQKYIDQGRTPDIARVLFDVELEMNGIAQEAKPKQSNVLSGANFTRAKTNGKVTLTEEDERTARRMNLDPQRLAKVKGIMSSRNSSVFTAEDFK